MAGLPGINPRGSGLLYSDLQGPRVSLIWVDGMGHAWPGGTGRSAPYVNSDNVNWAATSTAFFFEANRRVSRNVPPEVTIDQGLVDGRTITVGGTARDPDGAIAALSLELIGDFPQAPVDILPTLVGDVYSYTTAELPDNAVYTPVVTATDDAGLASQAVGDPLVVGEPPNAPPLVTILDAGAAGDCIAVDVRATDDTAVASVDVAIGGGPWQPASFLGGEDWRREDCGYTPGTYATQARATDDAGLTSDPASGPDVEVLGWTCREFFDDNYAHVAANRAYVGDLVYVYARGSNQSMGLYNVFVTNWLREVAQDYYEVGRCP